MLVFKIVFYNPCNITNALYEGVGGGWWEWVGDGGSGWGMVEVGG